MFFVTHSTHTHTHTRGYMWKCYAVIARISAAAAAAAEGYSSALTKLWKLAIWPYLLHIHLQNPDGRGML